MADASLVAAAEALDIARGVYAGQDSFVYRPHGTGHFEVTPAIKIPYNSRFRFPLFGCSM